MAVRVRLSDPANQAKRNLISTCWNNVTFERDESATKNQHETCAAIRRAMEMSVFAKTASNTEAGRKVVFVDVGGNPTRTQNAAALAFGARRANPLREFVYHSQTPKLSAADFHRQLNPQRVGNCTCSFQQCSFREHHVRQHITPGCRVVYNFTDSIYYIDFQALLHVLVRDNAIAIGCNHEFPSYPTTIAIPHDSVHEGTAVVRQDGTVVMSVEGNGTTYHHANFVFPKSEIPGTLFNADISLRSLTNTTYHGMLDNTAWSLSFERLYTCGTYVGWQAIPVPRTFHLTRNPELTHFKVGIYTAECLALRADTPEAVRTVVVKMMRRNGTPLETLPRVVAQTLSQIQAIGRPIIEVEPSTRFDWWGVLCRGRRRIVNALEWVHHEDDDPGPDVEGLRPEAWAAALAEPEGDGEDGNPPADAPQEGAQPADAGVGVAGQPPGQAPHAADQPEDIALPDHLYVVALNQFLAIGQREEAADYDYDAAFDRHNPAEAPRGNADQYDYDVVLARYLEGVEREMIAEPPGGEALPAGEQMGQEAEAPNPQAVPPAPVEVIAPVVEVPRVEPRAPAPRAVPQPKRRMGPLTPDERIQQRQTRRQGNREVAIAPKAASRNPQGPKQPLLPGPGIQPPVAPEPRGPRQQNPPVNINVRQLWKVKDKG